MQVCEELGHRIGSPKCRYTHVQPKFVNFPIYMLVSYFSCLFQYLPNLYALFFRRKRAEKAPPLVVEQGWSMKKPRMHGYRAKRTNLANATLMANETVVAEPVTNVAMQSEPDLDVLSLTEPVPPVLEAAVQSEPVSDVLLLPEPPDLVQTKPVPPLDLVVQIEPDLAVVVQTEQDPDVEEVQQVKEVLGRAVGKPTGCGKKTKSINKLCAAEVDKDKKSSGEKEKKLSGKKRPKK